MDKLNSAAGMQPLPAVRVLLADDNQEITSLVTDYLSAKGDIELVGAVNDGAQAL